MDDLEQKKADKREFVLGSVSLFMLLALLIVFDEPLIGYVGAFAVTGRLAAVYRKI